MSNTRTEITLWLDIACPAATGPTHGTCVWRAGHVISNRLIDKSSYNESIVMKTTIRMSNRAIEQSKQFTRGMSEPVWPMSSCSSDCVFMFGVFFRIVLVPAMPSLVERLSVCFVYVECASAS